MHDQSYPNPSQPVAGGYPPASPGSPEPARRTGLWVAICGVLALLLVAGGLAAFGPFRASSATDAADLPTSRGAASTTGTSAVTRGIELEVPTSVEVPGQLDETDAPVSTPTGGPVANPNPSGGSGSGSNGVPTPPPAPSSPAPAITSFETPGDIDCHNGDSQMFTASWSTTNAVKVTISIDGPGIYKTYGPTGSDSLPFSCSSSHTFLLTAYGHDGSTVTRSITLQPRNVQMPDSGDQDADAQASASSDDEI